MLTLLPATILTLVLGGYFTWIQWSGLHDQLLQRGQLITQQLAPLSAQALNTNNSQVLQRIANQALEQPDVRSVSFFNASRNLLAHSGPRMLSPLPAQSSILAQSSGQESSRFLMPVYQHHLNLTSEIPEAPNNPPLGWVELELSHTNTLVSGYRSLLTSMLLISMGLIITGLLAVRMSRSISYPLRQIQRSVAQLKEGNLKTRLPPLGSQELDELAAGINLMAESLQNAQEELQHSIDQATEDVRQNLETIEIQNIELDLARKEALEASRIKSEFLANMSHEIRTPLNGILGFTNLLQKSELSPRQLDYLKTIEKSADSLLGIINEILDFSKIEAGKLVLENVQFNLRDLLQDALTILAPAAHAKELELLSLVYRDTPLSMIGDPQRIKQILTNLVSNAIKFTQTGTIVVRAMIEDESVDRVQLRISVQDTGIGLSDKDLRELFQAFTQADNSLSRQAGGTGLGLVISKRLVEQMGGEIGAESTPNEGSEFWISLNLPKGRNDEDDLPQPPLVGRRIAILEKHELARQSLQHQLEDCGMQVNSFAQLPALIDTVKESLLSSEPIEFALLGVSTQTILPEQLEQPIRELKQLSCKALLLCPTTEQAFYQSLLDDPHQQLHVKPACTRTLQRALVGLLNPSQQQLAEPRKYTGRSPQILCVDDNPANLLLVQTLLDDLGAKVHTADNGYDAVEMAGQQHFDLIFMDVQMPGMDGRQATEEIRLQEGRGNSPHVPIIALTAHALANEKRNLLQSGMDDYLTKPINERQLSQVILKWTGIALRHGEEQAPTAPPSGVLKVVDPEEGLRLAAGKADLAEEMMGMLLSGLENDRQAIRQAHESNDRNALIERVHRLHGATRYCGVPQLRAACQRSETLLKQNDPAAKQALEDLDDAILNLARTANAAENP
ncbi:response regulator [Ectopseudomonas mendocina]|uniref:histidine kinase n=1 Tax=Ectopseudomonas mendocina TaxID=300 RepID=A0ABZ2RCK7_ECTME